MSAGTDKIENKGHGKGWDERNIKIANRNRMAHIHKKLCTIWLFCIKICV